MKNKVLDFFINTIKKYYKYDDTKLLEIRYGLESLYLSILKFIIIFIISFFINTTKELCLFFLTYGILRAFAFGVHAKKSIHCWIISILSFGLIPYLIKVYNINFYIIMATSIICLLLIIIYSPADTEKRPLINKKKRLIFKILSIIVTATYIILIIIMKDYYKNILFYSILLETIFILPITYKLLGVKYNNYKRYKGRRNKNEIIS
ncbi:MAG: accessory gene regulator B family protein [Bacilli bacterium]|nr:accessory gene regulator B family protein [Bacilli bacterium]